MTHAIEGRTLTLPPGRTLYRAGDDASHAFVIHDGIVKLYSDTLGANASAPHSTTQRLSDLASPGDIIGLHDQYHPHTAITASDTTLTITEPRYLLKHGAGDLLLRYISRHNRRTQHRFQQQEYPVAIRLGELLLDLIERFPDPSDQHHSRPLPLTHHELADLIHSSRITVTRCGNDLQTFNALNGGHGQYRISAQGVYAYLEYQTEHATL